MSSSGYIWGTLLVRGTAWAAGMPHYSGANSHVVPGLDVCALLDQRRDQIRGGYFSDRVISVLVRFSCHVQRRLAVLRGADIGTWVEHPRVRNAIVCIALRH